MLVRRSVSGMAIVSVGRIAPFANASRDCVAMSGQRQMAMGRSSLRLETACNQAVGQSFGFTIPLPGTKACRLHGTKACRFVGMKACRVQRQGQSRPVR